MKKEKKYLKLYKEWIKTGKIGTDSVGNHNGLCNTHKLGSDPLFELFIPNIEDEVQLEKDGLSTSYWASGQDKNDYDNNYAFTPLRQTIVLFLAAMNDEL